MRRRDAIALVGLAPFVSRAQAQRVVRVGVLETTALTQNMENFQAFRKGMEERRYVEGRSLETLYRAAEGRTERFFELAVELVRANVDLLLTRGTPATQAAKRATATIPIVMTAVADPVEAGVAASLARPGGNVTGLTSATAELMQELRAVFNANYIRFHETEALEAAAVAPEDRPPLELTETALEGLLFVAERPLTRREIATLAGVDRETVDARLGDLEVSLRERGIRLIVDGDRIELATAPEAGALVARYIGADAIRLSPASLETLAIVAYRQPVTRGAIERIRGVDSGIIARADSLRTHEPSPSAGSTDRRKASGAAH